MDTSNLNGRGFLLERVLPWLIGRIKELYDCTNRPVVDHLLSGRIDKPKSEYDREIVCFRTVMNLCTN